MPAGTKAVNFIQQAAVKDWAKAFHDEYGGGLKMLAGSTGTQTYSAGALVSR